VFFAEAQLRLPERYTGHYYAALVPFYDVFAIAGAVCGATLAAVSTVGAGWAVAGAIALPVVLTARWYLGRNAAAPERSLA
jgi:hypothetical protein